MSLFVEPLPSPQRELGGVWETSESCFQDGENMQVAKTTWKGDRDDRRMYLLVA